MNSFGFTPELWEFADEKTESLPDIYIINQLYIPQETMQKYKQTSWHELKFILPRPMQSMESKGSTV